MRKLGEAPHVHPTAEVTGSTLGRFTEIAERCRIEESSVGDYSYLMQDCAVWNLSLIHISEPTRPY